MTDRKRELKQTYKEMKTEAGVFQIKNTVNGKVLLIATPNLKTMNGHRLQLRIGSHRNKQLQAEWTQYGEEAFVFEVVEVLDNTDESALARKDDLRRLEQKWLDELQPYGERGYNQASP